MTDKTDFLFSLICWMITIFKKTKFIFVFQLRLDQTWSTKNESRMCRALNPWMLSKDVVLAVLYYVYLVKRVLSLVDTVQYSLRAWAWRQYLPISPKDSPIDNQFEIYASNYIWENNMEEHDKEYFFVKPISSTKIPQIEALNT